MSLLVLEATISVLRLPLFARQLWYFVGGGLGIILGGWLFVRMVQVSGRLIGRRVERHGGADATAVIRLCERTLTVIIFAFVIVELLRLMNIVKDVSTLVAGLGVGGIAIALAAQKTLENLFGGISIIFDKTIRVGDGCRIGTQTGTVEDIGLRSTSLRTDARTVLTVPNGQLSAMNIENFGMREKSYFYHVVGIRVDTSSAQMHGLLDALRNLLKSDPRVERGTSKSAPDQTRPVVARSGIRRLHPDHRRLEVFRSPGRFAAEDYGDRGSGRHVNRVPIADALLKSRQSAGPSGGVERVNVEVRSWKQNGSFHGAKSRAASSGESPRIQHP